MNDLVLDVLIVDDSPEDLTAARLYLAEAAADAGFGFKWQEAATGTDGLSSYASNTPGCIVLDYSLPDMNGLEFLEHLRAPAGEVPVPVVMLTASSNPALTAAALRAGAQEYLPKHFMGPELLWRAVQSARDRFALQFERRRIQADLHAASSGRAAAEARLEDLVNGAPGVLFQAELGSDGHWRPGRYVSRNVIDVLGYTAEHMMAREDALTSLMDGASLEAHHAAVRTALSGGDGSYQCSLRHAAGHVIRARITARTSRTPEGGWLFTGNLLNITDLYEANLARVNAEARLELLLQDGPGILFQNHRIADTWHRTYVSANVAAILGYPPEHATEARAIDPMDAAGTITLNEAIESARLNGLASCEFRVRHRDGHPVWMRAHLTARDTGGALLLTGFMVDISAEQTLSEALTAARRELEEAVSSGPGYLYRLTVSPDGSTRQDYVSDGIERILGYSREEVTGPDWFTSVLDPEFLPVLAEEHGKLLRLEDVANEYRVRTKQGAWIWTSDVLRPASRPEPDGSVRVVGYVTDITALKERTAQLQHASRLSVLGEMATGMAHELRQPLAGISFAAQNADAALEVGNVESARLRLERIVRQTERASQIIEHLRQFGSGADVDVPASPVSLRIVVAEALGLVGETIRQDGIEISSLLQSDVPLVAGWQIQLEQVLVNLLLNARDALVANRPAGGRSIRIAAERTAEGRSVRMTIADNGGGISAELLPRLFQPFVTTKLAEKGTGLGLAICHGIVSRMNGEIGVRNDGDGAVFTLILPAAG